MDFSKLLAKESWKVFYVLLFSLLFLKHLRGGKNALMKFSACICLLNQFSPQVSKIIAKSNSVPSTCGSVTYILPDQSDKPCGCFSELPASCWGCWKGRGLAFNSDIQSQNTRHTMQQTGRWFEMEKSFIDHGVILGLWAAKITKTKAEMLIE